MMFSIQVLDALHRLGVHVTEAGADAYFYAWRVVGAMLGIDDAAAPADLAEARDFSDLYMAKFMGPCPEGVELTRQLTDLYEDVVPGTLLDPLVPVLIRYLVGDTAADWLEVPRSAVFDQLVPVASLLLGVTEHLKERSPLAATLIDRLGAVTTRSELSSLTRGRVMHYAIPDHLKDEYGVDRPKGGRWTPPPVSALLADQRIGRIGTNMSSRRAMSACPRAPGETSMNS